VKPKVLYLAAKDGYFFSHRLDLAKRAQRAGYEVALAAPEGPYRERIRAEGVPVYDVPMQRQGRNPLADLGTLRAITALYRRLRPSLVHHVAIKPILYGTLAAKLAGVPAVVNAMAGMGYVFTSDELLSRALRPFVKGSFKRLVNADNARIILQNPDDIDRWVSWGVMRRDRIALIRGAGVDIDKFAPKPEPEGEIQVLLPARFLYDKGLGEFVLAAQALKGQGIQARFTLLGEPDAGNPMVVPPEKLAEWQAQGFVHIAPWRDDVHVALAESHIVCLPSYREGLPKSLLEAAAAGRPIVTTDVPGCREAVTHDDNGFLVPVRDAGALAQALRRLIEDPALRARMGARGRARACAEFSSAHVAEQTFAVYESLLAPLGLSPQSLRPQSLRPESGALT